MRALLRIGSLVLLAVALPACGGGGDENPGPTEQAWSIHDPQNVPILSNLNGQLGNIVTDGAGGAIITFMRSPSGTTDIYAQRVDSSGAIRWTVNGVGVVTAFSFNYQVLSDGAGGAVFVWQDFRSGTSTDLYAQRIDGTGTLLWGAGGKPVTVAAGEQTASSIVSDGAGGFIIAWTDGRGADNDIYAQRLNASGNPLWAADGVPVCTAAGAQAFPELAPDGAGGAVAIWQDTRNGNVDLFGQRFDSNGVLQWAAGGVALSTASGDQRNQQVVSDGAGGVIAVWEDLRNGITTDVYAGRLTGAGTAPWTADGIAISTANGDQAFPKIVTDGAGGAILVWMDEDGGPASFRSRCQRLDAAGNALWTAGGQLVATFLARQSYPVLDSDGYGGAVFAWQDLRGGSNIYAQRLGPSGASLWGADGVSVCTQIPDIQSGPRIVSNGFGGAVVAWTDYRPPATGSGNIFAQGITSAGQ